MGLYKVSPRAADLHCDWLYGLQFMYIISLFPLTHNAVEGRAYELTVS